MARRKPNQPPPPIYVGNISVANASSAAYRPPSPPRPPSPSSDRLPTDVTFHFYTTSPTPSSNDAMDAEPSRYTGFDVDDFFETDRNDLEGEEDTFKNQR